MEETCEYENLFLSYSNYKLLDWGSNIHYISHSKKKKHRMYRAIYSSIFLYKWYLKSVGKDELFNEQNWEA